MRNLLLENEFVKFEIIEGIVLSTLKVDLTDLDLMKSIVETRLKLTETLEPYPFIVNIKNVKESKKEVRDFLASQKAAEHIVCTAILINSMLTATIGNFYLRLSKPPVPTKLFTTEEDAVEWLKEQSIKLKYA